MALTGKEQDDFMKWFYKKAIIVTLSFSLFMAATVIAMSFNQKTKDEDVIRKISQVDDSRQKEILMKIQKIRSDKFLNKEFQSAISKQSNALNSELQKVQEIISGKEYVPKTDRIRALQHVINAKGYMEKLKGMQLPVDTLLTQIKQLEKELYQTTK